MVDLRARTSGPQTDVDRIDVARVIRQSCVDEEEAWIRVLEERAMPRTLHVYTDDEEFVIAASPEDAIAVMRGLRYDGPAMAWTQMADDRPFTADLDNGDGPVKRTCAEWCAARGRGYFCALNH